MSIIFSGDFLNEKEKVALKLKLKKMFRDSLKI